MSDITLVVYGGSRGSPGLGHGSYAVIRGRQRHITRVEFGSPMTSEDAEYDTLVTALESFIRYDKPAEIRLDLQCSHGAIVRDLTTAEPSARRDRVLEMLRQFETFAITQIPREQAARAVRG